MLHRPNDPYGHILRYEPGDLVRVVGSKLRVIPTPWVGRITKKDKGDVYEVEPLHPTPGESTSVWRDWELLPATPLDAIAELGD